MDTEKLEEEKHLKDCLAIVWENIREYEEKEQAYKREVTELFQSVKKARAIPTAPWLRVRTSWSTLRIP